MSQFTGEIHPYADMFPMLPDDDLDALAADISANGQRHPILLTFDGVLVDGRNRLEACKRAGVEPKFRTIDADPYTVIVSENIERRHLKKYQQAMARALALADQGKRRGGRFEYGTNSLESSGFASEMRRCGVVIDHRPDLAQAVLDGDTTLDQAYEEVQKIRRQAAEDKERIAEIRQHDPDILDMDDLSLAEKWVVYQERHAKRIKAEQERARDIKQTNDFISRSVLLLSHLGTSASKEHGPALPDFLTHWDAKDSNVPPDLLNQRLIDQAISALQRLKDEGWLA